jgi:hypothetical protein
MAGNIKKFSFRNPLLHQKALVQKPAASPAPPFPHPPKPPSQTDVVNLYIRFGDI